MRHRFFARMGVTFVISALLLAAAVSTAAGQEKAAPNYRIQGLEIQEVLKDPKNFISEASIDARGDEVVVVYVRHRGLRHTDDGSIMFVASHDGGRTWDLSTHVVAMPESERWGFTSPACLILKDGTILAFAVANTAVGERAGSESRFRGGYVARSTDRGRTWSKPERIDAWPMRVAGPWDNPLEMPDGTLVLAVYGTVDNAQGVGTYRETSRAALLWSDDKGVSWYAYGTIAYDPSGLRHFYEPSIARTPDGRLVALSRERLGVFGNNPPGGYLYFSESEDGGATWSPYRRTEVWGYPADLVTLKDGSILNVYGHRKDPMSVKVVVSEDGRSWREQNASILYNAPNYDTRDLASNKAVIDSGYRHVGYPSACVLDDGTVLAAFHSFNEDRKQIVLVARFRMVKN
jgi:sialidase-1